MIYLTYYLVHTLCLHLLCVRLYFLRDYYNQEVCL